MKTVNKKGFTLIEVVLVLAIGGLIFLLAFLAFQQVSRNRRDTQRRSDAARMSSAYNDLVGDRQISPGGNAIGATLAGSAWEDRIDNIPGLNPPSGPAYTRVTDEPDSVNEYRIIVGYQGATGALFNSCGGTPMTSNTQGKVELYLENGDIVCRDTGE